MHQRGKQTNLTMRTFFFVFLFSLIGTTLAAQTTTQTDRRARVQQRAEQRADRYGITPDQRDELQRLRTERREAGRDGVDRSAYRDARRSVYTEEQRSAMRTDRNARRSNRPNTGRRRSGRRGN